MYTIYVNENAPPVSDKNAMQCAKIFMKCKKVHICNSIVLDAIRLLMLKGEIKPTEVELHYKNKVYYFEEDYVQIVDKNGVPCWPDGMLDQGEQFARAMILKRQEVHKMSKEY